jgi:low affinity Fe/Cu permease
MAGSGMSGFHKFAVKTSEFVGSAGAFTTAILIIAVWGISGPLFHYSDAWQLYINTGTTIVTFLMVFLIQYTQNRDAKAMHLKLDELLRAMHGAHTEMVNLKDLSDEELLKLEKAFERLARFAARAKSADNPEVESVRELSRKLAARAREERTSG